MSNFHKIIVGLVILFVALWLSNEEFKDEIAEQKHYCDMVAIKAWPDFRPEVNCKATEGYFNE